MDTPYIAILYTDPDVLPDVWTRVVVAFIDDSASEDPWVAPVAEDVSVYTRDVVAFIDDPANGGPWFAPVAEEVSVYTVQKRFDEEPNVLLEEATSVLAAHGWRICAYEGWAWGESGAYVAIEREG